MREKREREREEYVKEEKEERKGGLEVNRKI